MNADLKIAEIKALPTSFPVPPENRVALGIGMDAADVVGVWAKIYKMQLASHGMAAGMPLYKLPIHPHSSMTGLNHAASIHFLAAIDNGGYFEGDVSRANRFRDDLVSNPAVPDRDGNVRPLDRPGLGLEVNEEFLVKHPAIEGPGYI